MGTEPGSPGSRRGQVLLSSVARRARMEGRPRVGAGVGNPALDQGRIPAALGRPSALREARAVRVRANHGPPERGRQSGGRTARESTSGAGSGICTRKVGRQGRWTRPGPTARPKIHLRPPSLFPQRSNAGPEVAASIELQGGHNTRQEPEGRCLIPLVGGEYFPPPSTRTV